MKLGLAIWLDIGLTTTLEYVKEAEKAGYDFVWFPDHYFLKDTFAVQAMAAQVTSKVKLGTAVTSPFLRHPVALASAVSSIFEASNGRAVYGIGSGGYEFPSQLYYSIDKPVAACREAIEIAKSLWKGGSVTYEGKVFKVKNAALGYKTQVDIPVYLAARGPKMLELSGELADGVITHGVTDQLIEYCLDRAAKGAQRRGKTIENLDYVCFTTIVPSRTPEKARRMLRPAALGRIGGEYSEELLPLYGLTKDEVAPIRAAVRSGESKSAAEMVTDKMVDSVIIVGTESECTDKIGRLARLGVTNLVTGIPRIDGVSPEQFIRDIADLTSPFRSG